MTRIRGVLIKQKSKVNGVTKKDLKTVTFEGKERNINPIHKNFLQSRS